MRQKYLGSFYLPEVVSGALANYRVGPGPLALLQLGLTLLVLLLALVVIALFLNGLPENRLPLLLSLGKELLPLNRTLGNWRSLLVTVGLVIALVLTCRLATLLAILVGRAGDVVVILAILSRPLVLTERVGILLVLLSLVDV